MTTKEQFFAVLLAAILSMPTMPLAQQTPLSGKWEKRFTTVIYDFRAKAYAPLEQPTELSCLTAESFKQMPDLSPTASKARNAELGMTCGVSEVKVQRDSLSWRMQCEPGYDSHVSVVTTQTEVRLSITSKDNSNGHHLGPDGTKSELLLRRIGDCD
ncbi:DUF3617 domain-containing protein [Rhodoferax lacus]|uniref:DUF3617 domain-containing protein n=1 Tax=Rhodoferax lacus TaxID=2184758 RepID=UPI0011C130EA|nr:DUF3617 family protein [Rhodoferax lacus]